MKNLRKRSLNWTTFLFFIVSLPCFAGGPIYESCGKKFSYRSQTQTYYSETHIVNIPPGQDPGPKIYKFYLNTFIVPDGVAVSINGSLIGTIWLGSEGSPSGNGYTQAHTK